MLDLERHVAGSNHNSGVAFWNWDRLGQHASSRSPQSFLASALGVFDHVAAVMRKPSKVLLCMSSNNQFGVTNQPDRSFFFPALARQIAAGLEKVDAMAWHAASA